MFALGAFVLATVAQELGRGTAARRRLTGDPVPVALVGWWRATAAATAATSSTPAWPCC